MSPPGPQEDREPVSFSSLLPTVSGCGWHLGKLPKQESRSWDTEDSVQPLMRASSGQWVRVEITGLRRRNYKLDVPTTTRYLTLLFLFLFFN